MEKIATRGAYGEELVALADEYPELVVLDADLSSATMTKSFAASIRSASSTWASPRRI